MVTGPVPVDVVDRLEAVEIDEQDRQHLARTGAPHERVLEALEEQDAVRQPGQGVVHRAPVRTLGCVEQVGPGLGVDQVRGGHIGQRLRRQHVLAVQWTGCGPVQVQSSKLLVPMVEREGEDGRQPGLDRSRAKNPETIRPGQIGHGNRFAGAVGGQTRSFAQLGLQLLVAQGRLVGGGDVAWLGVRRDQGHPGRRDRHDLHDPQYQMLQNALNGKIGEHGAGELAHHRGQLLLAGHDPPSDVMPLGLGGVPGRRYRANAIRR